MCARGAALGKTSDRSITDPSFLGPFDVQAQLRLEAMYSAVTWSSQLSGRIAAAESVCRSAAEGGTPAEVRPNSEMLPP